MNNTVGLSLLELQTLVKESTNGFGDIDGDYMAKINEVIQCSLVDYSSIFALRIDLRFANPEAGCPDSPVCTQNVEGQVMKRFIASLKSQLSAYDERRKRMNVRVHPGRDRERFLSSTRKFDRLIRV